MKPTVDPPRLLDGTLDEQLRAGLEAARDDLPSAIEEARMLARFPFPDGGPPHGSSPDGLSPGAGNGTGGGAPAGSAAGGLGAIGATIAGVLAGAALALLGGGAWYASSRPSHPVAPLEAPAITTGAFELPAPNAPAPEVRAPDPAVAITSAPPPTAIARPTASGAAAASMQQALTETHLLRKAQAALGTHPARAIELCREHERRFPAGLLGQERDVIRIQALLALGRREDARTLVDAFRARHPGSAHVPRLADMLGDPAAPAEGIDKVPEDRRP
jgi:hypothetical protein